MYIYTCILHLPTKQSLSNNSHFSSLRCTLQLWSFEKQRERFGGERGPFPSSLMVGLLDEKVGGLLELLPFVNY